MLSSQQISEIQSVLSAGGFLHSKVNGIWDRLTQEAYNGYLLKYADLANKTNGISLNQQPTSMNGLPQRLQDAIKKKVATLIEPKAPEALLEKKTLRKETKTVEKQPIQPAEPLIQKTVAPIVTPDPVIEPTVQTDRQPTVKTKSKRFVRPEVKKVESTFSIDDLDVDIK